MPTDMPPPFLAFGPAHLGALALVAAFAGLLVALVRRWPSAATPVRTALGLGIVGFLGFELDAAAREGWLTWKTLLPLELCDAAMVLAVVTLVRPCRPCAEVLYFWAASGSVLAMLTPDVAWGFPRWEFVVFFGLHGFVLVAALVLVFGLGLRPRPGAPFRALAATAGMAATAGAANLLLGTNFMYLRGKPEVPTPLDWMGPWPVYVGVAAAAAFGLFQLLALPFRAEWLTTPTSGPRAPAPPAG